MAHPGESVLADVTILFAREDRARAEGIGAALAGSGFSVEAIPFETLTGTLESPAIVALWSRTMAASRAAISLGQSALAMGRLISARLDINVPSGLFRDHVMHDLIRWTGDPDDQVLDSLVADADQLVLAARSAPAAPSPNLRPAAPPPPEPVRLQQVVGGGSRPVARPSPANDLTPAVAADPAAEEATYWKAIRASTNRDDFINYLNRFGDDGLFAELAVQKLASLPSPVVEPPAPQPPVARFADSWRFGADWSTRGPAAQPTQNSAGALDSRPQPAARAPQAPPPAPATPPRERRPATPAAAPVSRAAPPPAAKPAQAPYPPSTRIPLNPVAEPAALRRGPAGGGAGAFDRELADAPWDRRPSLPPNDFQDNGDRDFVKPSRAAPAARKRGGGFGAVLGVLIALGVVGGGAIYWFVRTEQGTDPSQNRSSWPDSEAAPARVDPDSLAAGPPAVEIATASNLSARPDIVAPGAGTAPRRASAAPAPGAPAAPGSVSRVEQPKPAQVLPAATAASAGDSAPGGVAVLPPSTPSPRAEDPAANVEAVFSYGRPVEEGPTVTAPTASSLPAASAPESSARPAPAAPALPKANIVWARRPSAASIASVYPQEANRRGIEGKAVLNCSVLANGELLCNISSETPTGQGFGKAAIEAARRFRSAPTLSNGTPSAGVRTSVTISFAMN